MKTFVLVATLAFVAVQLSLAAPAPDDNKKEEPAPVQEKSATPISPVKVEDTPHTAKDKAADAPPPEAPPAPAEKAH